MLLMMKKWSCLVCAMMGFLILAFSGAPARAGDPPMVEKHIFSPEPGAPDAMKGKKSPVVKKLERELVFTGVIISPHGRQAMIRERATARGERQSALHKEGDEIKGMTIKKIGNNFIVLAGEGKEVRLNLYQGKKKRPAPPALPSVQRSASRASAAKQPFPSAGVPKQPGKRPVAKKGNTPNRQGVLRRVPTNTRSIKKPGAPGTNRPSNPFLEALKRAAQKQRESGKTASPANNPFLEAIRRAQRGQ